jgi:hypothetical protein
MAFINVNICKVCNNVAILSARTVTIYPELT